METQLIPTQLLYLEEFDVLTCTAQIVDIRYLEETQSFDIILNQTCFYPRGGGQEWDTGTIKSADEKNVFEVEQVRLDEHGIVHHIGKYIAGEFVRGAQAFCSVFQERRILNTRLHSAGHIIDFAVDQLKIPWVTGKGAHYPHMSFVEYKGELDPQKSEKLRHEIEELCNRVIAQGGENEIRFMPVSQMHTVCRNVPTNIPTNKPGRVVIYCGTFGVPCGGTHVKNRANIGPIVITKIKRDKELVKVSYALKSEK